MLARQTPIQLPMTLLQYVVLNVQRVDDWMVRECPQCHHIGYVSIYPHRDAEAMEFITRSDWVCKQCADIKREVDRNFYTGGGDAIVH